MLAGTDVFGVRAVLPTAGGPVVIHRLDRLPGISLDSMPYGRRLLLESALRHSGTVHGAEDAVQHLIGPTPSGREIPFMPARVILQDLTGVPAVVDLAALRAAVRRLGGNPERVNPLVPADLVIDHSVQVDYFGTADAFTRNVALEFDRNNERYQLLRWAQRSLDSFRVVPPGTGIVHQVNLEYLASVVCRRNAVEEAEAFPDTLVGTDSHTTMINGLGVLGWGVGGIEAEAVLLGQPCFLVAPEVVGVRVRGEMPHGATATDLVLTVTERLRRHGVVGKFVEFFGEGVVGLPLADRATLANMAPEYGATTGFFPVDTETLRYLATTGRTPEQLDLVERYCKAQGLFRTDGVEPHYDEVVELDLGTVEPSLAGPRRPQDRVPLRSVPDSFAQAFPGDRTASGEGGLANGSVVIAAITSCTNTSNPSVMIAAGLLAQRAVQRGLRVPPFVKTSMAPGSRVVTEYLQAAGLLPALEQLGFSVVGYGCTTCIGNSGSLPPAVAEEVETRNLSVAAVLSGNRNFEGRINPLVKANYLAAPPLVVAYALAGTVHIDLTRDPVGTDPAGHPVHLADLWPSAEEVSTLVERVVQPALFRRQYGEVFVGDERWRNLETPEGLLFAWDPQSTYVLEPPFVAQTERQPSEPPDLQALRVLALLGDSITTDHISPAGAIGKDSPAGHYLMEHGVPPAEFNTYGARRGNHEVMVRGTFANVRLRNRMAPGREGGWTTHQPSGEVVSIYEAAQRYAAEGTELLVIAGREYGTGSSRDWAAKGTALLGVQAVLAQSFERIHRANLVGMGVLPLEFEAGEGADTLGLDGREVYALEGVDGITPRARITVTATATDGRVCRFTAIARLDSRVDVEYYRHGGILPAVLRQFLP